MMAFPHEKRGVIFPKESPEEIQPFEHTQPLYGLRSSISSSLGALLPCYTGKKIGIANHDHTMMNAIDVIDTDQPPNSMAFRLSLRASPIGAIMFEPG